MKGGATVAHTTTQTSKLRTSPLFITHDLRAHASWCMIAHEWEQLSHDATRETNSPRVHTQSDPPHPDPMSCLGNTLFRQPLDGLETTKVIGAR